MPLGFVGEHDGIGLRPAEQTFGNWAVTRLAGRQTNSSPAAG
jgi:hypothetical protein